MKGESKERKKLNWKKDKRGDKVLKGDIMVEWKKVERKGNK